MNEPIDLVKAAKVVVALSGWNKDQVNGREVFQTSYMAVEVLRAAIEQHENPRLVLRMAPEGIEPGRV